MMSRVGWFLLSLCIIIKAGITFGHWHALWWQDYSEWNWNECVSRCDSSSSHVCFLVVESWVHFSFLHFIFTRVRNSFFYLFVANMLVLKECLPLCLFFDVLLASMNKPFCYLFILTRWLVQRSGGSFSSRFCFTIVGHRLEAAGPCGNDQSPVSLLSIHRAQLQNNKSLASLPN